MRKCFAHFLSKKAKENSAIKLLTADLGFGLFEDFQQNFPTQFLNLGVAEALMVGVASGLARLGFTPYVYSIAPFLYLRALEQIKLDVDWPKLNVKFIGVGAGVGYSQAGNSHYSLEDLTVMSTLPNMRIYVPTDSQETELCLEEAHAYDGPCYIRLANHCREWSKTSEYLPVREILPGQNLAIFSSGTRTAFWAEQTAVLKDAKVGLYHLSRLSPFPDTEVARLLRGLYEVWVIEDQYMHLGLFQQLARLSAEHSLGPTLRPKGFLPCYPQKFGTVEYMRGLHQSDDTSILTLLKEKYF